MRFHLNQKFIACFMVTALHESLSFSLLTSYARLYLSSYICFARIQSLLSLENLDTEKCVWLSASLLSIAHTGQGTRKSVWAMA